MNAMSRMIAQMVMVCVVLALVPLGFYLSGYQWQIAAEGSAVWQWFWWMITETGSVPVAIIVSLGLMIFLWRFGGQKRWKMLLLLVLLSMALTQIAKNGLKHYFAQPRPYIAQMYQRDEAKIAAFYQDFSKSAQREAVAQYYQQQAHTIQPLVNHREREIAYRFPSGHTIFVVSWVLMFIGLAQRRRVVVMVTLWAMLVMSSRVLLGMHLPQDLAAAIPLAFIINLPLLWWYRFRNAIVSL